MGRTAEGGQTRIALANKETTMAKKARKKATKKKITKGTLRRFPRNQPSNLVSFDDAGILVIRDPDTCQAMKDYKAEYQLGYIPLTLRVLDPSKPSGFTDIMAPCRE